MHNKHYCASLPQSIKLSVELAQEKGSSLWLTALPIEDFGFSLHTSAFRSALALQYNCQPILLPSTCEFGIKFCVDHALSCPKGGFQQYYTMKSETL